MPRGGQRPGAGRKGGVTMPSYVTRVPADIPKELIENLPQLKDIIAHWENECLSARKSSARHYFLRQMIEEVRTLGY